MKKMIFSLEKYQNNLLENGISKDVFNLISDFDGIYDGDEILFFNKKDCWGQKSGNKEIINKDWCIPNKNHFMSKLCNFLHKG